MDIPPWADGQDAAKEMQDVINGTGPWRPWQYIGAFEVSPHKVRPNMLSGVKVPDAKKRMIRQQVTAVVVASMAINKMMGKSPDAGFEG